MKKSAMWKTSAIKLKIWKKNRYVWKTVESNTNTFYQESEKAGMKKKVTKI